MGYLRFLCFIITSFGIYRDSLEEKPTLIPLADELTIQEGSELRIQCSSQMPSLHFSFPMHTFMSPRSPHEILKSRNGTVTFLRPRAISLDTGWYACAAEDVEIENDFKILNHTQEDIAWIYVYVSSSEPFADRYYTFPKTIIILAGQPVIVPCRPTSPDLDVQLYRNFYIVNLTMSEQIRFDPKIGFVMEPAKSGDIDDIFQCKINGVEDDYTLSYSSATGRKPRMKPGAEELVLREGDNLRIDCYGKSKIQFIDPESSIGFFHTDESNPKIITDGEGNKTFLYSGMGPKNTGWYGCAEEGIDTAFQPYYIDYTRKEINWIYVFVESNTTKLLRVSSDYDSLWYKNGTSVVVPCRPTSPRFNVQLKSESEVLELDENVQFHRTLGFVMRRGPSQGKSCYTCVADKNFQLQECLTESTEIFGAPTPFIVQELNMLLVGEDLNLDCKAYTGYMYRLEWNIPATISEKRVKFSQTRWMSIFFGFYDTRKMLEIKNVTVHDSGKYICVSRNAKSSFKTTSRTVQIFNINSLDYIVESGKLDGVHESIKLQGQSIKWMIDYESIGSTESITWSSPSQQISRWESVTSSNSNKYKLWFTTGKREILEIRNLSFDDSGVYEHTVASFDNTIHSSKFSLNVRGPPIVFITNGSEPHYVAPGREFLTVCNTTGSPRPNITWNFVEHPNFPSDKVSFSVNFLNSKDVPGTRTNIWLSYSNMSTKVSGNLTCTACNLFNCSRATQRILVSDGIGRFGIIGPKDTPYFGDNVELTCAGSIYEFQNLSWAEFDECFPKMRQRAFNVKDYRTRFTIRQVLSLMNVTKCHQKSYSCIGQRIDKNIENASYNLQLNTPRKPQFTRSNLDGLMISFDPKLTYKRTWSLVCCADGDPQPNVTWFKDYSKLEESPKHRFVPSACELVVDFDPREDNGTRYTCRAENRFGKTEGHVDFVIKEMQNSSFLPPKHREEAEENNLFIAIIVLVSLLIVVLVTVVTGLLVQRHRVKTSRRKFKEEILKRFEEGALNCLNPKLDIVDQAEVLPYDEKWEYPRELLELGKVLGSGAFGIVRKARAKSIRKEELFTTVAVKMVRSTFRLHHMTALSRELKVLLYLGEHVNVVNLLGACTRDVTYGELFVIVEYCRFGNLQDYLFGRRADFINQIDEVTEKTIGPHYSTKRVSSSRNHVNTDHDCGSETGGSCCSSDSMGTEEDDGEKNPSSASLGCSLRTKYEGDYTDTVLDPICTKDLLCWAWQVARGMRYLGRRKVVHGDLAARNILLADRNVIKICDFGMAKALYKDEDYKKAGEDPLPLKWMAIESIKNRTFSIQSDIWSYGIVLWEFFTLAKSPYPGIHPKFLYQKLVNGHRMDRPEYAPKDIYHMMMKCWDADPTQRPTFEKIENEISDLLDYDAKTYYMELGAPYSKIEDETEETGKKDYLTMDPSEIVTVSFSTESDKLEFSNPPSHEILEPVGPGTSSVIKNIVPGPSFDTNATPQLG